MKEEILLTPEEIDKIEFAYTEACKYRYERVICRKQIQKLVRLGYIEVNDETYYSKVFH